MRDDAATAAVVARTAERFGRLDGVVTAAGVAGGGAVHDLTSEEWDRIISINLTGTFTTAKHALAQMLGQDPRTTGGAPPVGAIVTIASIEGLEGTSEEAPTTPRRAGSSC